MTPKRAFRRPIDAAIGHDRAVSSDQRNTSFGRGDPTREVSDEEMALVDEGRTARDPPQGGDR